MANIKITYLVLIGCSWIEVNESQFMIIMKKLCYLVTFEEGLVIYSAKGNKIIGLMISKEV